MANISHIQVLSGLDSSDFMEVVFRGYLITALGEAGAVSLCIPSHCQRQTSLFFVRKRRTITFIRMLQVMFSSNPETLCLAMGMEQQKLGWWLCRWHRRTFLKPLSINSIFYHDKGVKDRLSWVHPTVQGSLMSFFSKSCMCFLCAASAALNASFTHRICFRYVSQKVASPCLLTRTLMFLVKPQWKSHIWKTAAWEFLVYQKEEEDPHEGKCWHMKL